MIDRPVFKRTYHVRIIEPEGVLLLSERHEPLLLKGAAFCRIAPLLDGQHTVTSIIGALAGDLSALQVRFALAFLERRGYVVEADLDAMAARLAFWDSLNVDARQAERRLGETRVAVQSFGAVPVAPFVALLKEHGVQVGEPGTLTIALTDDYLHPDLSALNTAALSAPSDWLLVKPLGTVLWIGPLVRPRRTACWECLAQRLRLNRSVDRYLHRRLGTTAPFPVARAALPGTLHAACGLAALETVRAIVGDESATLENRIVTFDLVSRRAEAHVIVRRPQCAACGERVPPRVESQPIELERRPKAFTADGGHRVRSPEATLERYGHHVSPISGAVRHLERVPLASAPLLHVYDSGENRAATAASLDGLRQGLRNRSAGKGATDVQARASALGEALERYSGLFQGDEPRIQASFRELGDRAVHPNACMLFSQEQYHRREEWNARGSRFCRVPEPFDETAVIDWTPLWSLTRATTRYLPTADCYYGTGETAGSRWTAASSNGAAAGNTLEEAILQGFLELVERDSVALWWYNRIRRPAVDLDSFDEPYLAVLKAEYASLARDVWVLDVTSDLGIPSFAAMARRTDQPEEHLVFGFGAHLDPRIGVMRALTEMNQCLPWAARTLESGEADEMDRWLRTETLARQPYLVPLETVMRTASDFPRQWSDDLGDDVRRCQQIVEEKGLEMLVLDQTRPDIGLPVAKVLVPGLRHFWARFAPGRLYDVPVQLGWLARPLAEDALNPIAMFW